MTKFKSIHIFSADDVPDHILQEVCELMEKLGKAFAIACEGHDPNIVLSAFNRCHAAIIVALVTEDGLENATLNEVKGLIGNIEHLSGQKILKED